MQAKPLLPIWVPGHAPAGCRAYYSLDNKFSKTLGDASGNGNTATYSGSVPSLGTIWQDGPYGAQIGNLSIANFFGIDPPQQILHNGIFPWWSAVAFANTSTASQTLFSLGPSDGTTIQQIQLTINSGAAGTLLGFVRNNANNIVNFSAASQPLNDGKPHVAGLIAFGANSYAITLDGPIIATSTVNSPPPATLPWMTLGCFRRGAGNGGPTVGSIFAAAFGYGAVPDFTALANDWLSGTFRAIRPEDSLSAMLAAWSSQPTFNPAWIRQSPALGIGVY